MFDISVFILPLPLQSFVVNMMFNIKIAEKCAQRRRKTAGDQQSGFDTLDVSASDCISVITATLTADASCHLMTCELQLAPTGSGGQERRKITGAA